MIKFHLYSSLLFSLLLISGCAALYRVQLSDVAAKTDHMKPVSVKVSETTVNFREIGQIMKGVGKAVGSKPMQGAGKAFEYYETLFQWGPRTGTPVFNEFYARDIADRLAASCKAGYLTDITSIREARDYPVVKGEIVRIDATCVSR